MTVNNTGTEDWHVQLNQYNLALEKGKTYKIVYEAVDFTGVTRKIPYFIKGK